jgi:signal transduction histidine kinase
MSNAPIQPTLTDRLRFLTQWIEPHSSITNPVERHHYQFILSLFLSFGFVLAGILLFYMAFNITDPVLILSAGTLLITIIINYGIARTAYYRYTPYIACLILHLVFWYVLFATPFSIGIGLLFTALFIIPLTNLFLGTIPTIFSTIAHLIVAVIFCEINNISFESTFLIVLNIININIGLVIRDYYSRRLENSRRAVLEDAIIQSENARKTTEQANQELHKASLLIKENIRLRDEFMASMSHELRTPLNAISGFCGIMLNEMGGKIDHEARHMVSRIEENGLRLLLLINDILDLSSIGAGRVYLQEIPFEPRQLALKWQEKMRPFALEQGIDFDVVVADEMPNTLIGDAERITQIVLHLLSNAFKFTSEGGICVNVRPIDPARFQIEVSDTGIGISEEDQAFIFDDFRQLDSSSTREYGGLGIGLAIVRNLTQILQGTITLVSDRVIGGSTFTLTLPMQSAQILSDPVKE